MNTLAWRNQTRFLSEYESCNTPLGFNYGAGFNRRWEKNASTHSYVVLQPIHFAAKVLLLFKVWPSTVQMSGCALTPEGNLCRFGTARYIRIAVKHTAVLITELEPWFLSLYFRAELVKKPKAQTCIDKCPNSAPYRVWLCRRSSSVHHRIIPTSLISLPELYCSIIISPWSNWNHTMATIQKCCVGLSQARFQPGDMSHSCSSGNAGTKPL